MKTPFHCRGLPSLWGYCPAGVFTDLHRTEQRSGLREGHGQGRMGTEGGGSRFGYACQKLLLGARASTTHRGWGRLCGSRTVDAHLKWAALTSVAWEYVLGQGQSFWSPKRSCESGLLGSISWCWVRTVDALLPLLSALRILPPAPRSPGCCVNEPRKLCLRAFALVILYASSTFSQPSTWLCASLFQLLLKLTLHGASFSCTSPPPVSDPCSISPFFHYQGLPSSIPNNSYHDAYFIVCLLP